MLKQNHAPPGLATGTVIYNFQRKERKAPVTQGPPCASYTGAPQTHSRLPMLPASQTRKVPREPHETLKHNYLARIGTQVFLSPF